MESVLRCNNLKCRQQLHDRAIVTTCSHVFCAECADNTGLSRSTNAHRTCPACSASLHNPDDVVIAGLNPSEDYKTSVLGGLSPTIIMECASRGLAFHGYQTAQEIIYQEHLSKGLTEKYNTLNQQMDQLIHDANSQIKALQDKMQAMQAEYADLEAKNHDLRDAFKEKSKSQQDVQKLYQSLKAQVMRSHVANAAGDEAEFTLGTTRRDRFVDRIPGARTGSANFSQMDSTQHVGGRKHGRADSRSSGNGGQHRSGIPAGPSLAAHLQRRGLGARASTGQSASLSASSQAHRSHLPVLGGTRQGAFINPEVGPSYQASPLTRQPLGGGIGRDTGGFSLGHTAKGSRTFGGAANTGPMGR